MIQRLDLVKTTVPDGTVHFHASCLSTEGAFGGKKWKNSSPNLYTSSRDSNTTLATSSSLTKGTKSVDSYCLSSKFITTEGRHLRHSP